MLELKEWAASARFADRPWLLVGKGPTFERRHRFDLSQFNVLSLNHVVRHLAVDVAHIVDIDVVAECADVLAGNCRWLVMPRHPHVKTERSDRLLEDWFDEIPVLRELDEQGRLVWYNLLGSRVEGTSPVIGVRYFSSESALNILGRMGAKTVRSLGVDGGRAYAPAFADLDGTTRLRNGRPYFDLQFRQLETIAAEWGVDYRSLVEPLRIFVGTDESQVVAHRVLEYSIRKSASIPVEVLPMLNLRTPLPRDAANQPRVTFSFARFLIPELAGRQGRALYLDADMLVFGDVAELADLDFDGNRLLCTFQPEPPEVWKGNPDFHAGRHVGVMLLDCARLDWDIADVVAGLDQGRYTYEELVFGMCLVPPDEIADTIPREWNDLEHYDPDTTRLLHFTVVPTQPWKNDDNPLGEVWMSLYREAVEAGAVPPEEVEELIRKGLVKPSLAAALHLAPSRRSVLTSAALDLATARDQVNRLEGRVDALKQTWSWRIGDGVVRTLRAGRSLVHRTGRR